MGNDPGYAAILCKIHQFGAVSPVAGMEFDHNAVHA
jgi:hypothetical protein